jgi:hypothetical protein
MIEPGDVVAVLPGADESKVACCTFIATDSSAFAGVVKATGRRQILQWPG